MEQSSAIRLENVTKTFGPVVANKDICLDIRYGEILSLLGENGSGKTTLMNMLSGIYFPDAGKIYANGSEVSIRSPKDAFDLNIGMIHQHFKLVDIFTATENVVLGLSSDKKKDNLKAAAAKIREICDKYGFEVDPDQKVYNMSVSQKQTLEIVKVLYHGAEILILDEPTAVLTLQETRKLFSVLRNMKEAGKAIVIITHKLNEVLEISDRVSILRRGEYIGTVDTKDATELSLTEMMVGKKVSLDIERPIVEKKKPLLEIRNLSIKNDEGHNAINDVSFYIRGGEILGVAGIAGCGQKELCEAIAGLRKIEQGMMIHQGEDISTLTPKQILEKGISMSFIPEDRLGMGLAPSLSITDNMLLKTYAEGKSPFVDRKRGRAEAQKIISDLGVVTPSTETPVRRLSGGNVQKVLLGREIKSGPNVIITAYPVRGLDINSSYLIYDILNNQKKNDVGILFIGEDLDVMLSLCDKIMVLCHGKVMGIVNADNTSKEELGLMMTGAINLAEAKSTPDKTIGIAKDSYIKEETK
ncbi:MAG: ABC transporter ATP-binding protein [Clostridia bacterium]|nr:ABC transporter ATP-binding protein [Clostridia bacterium]